jgi:alkaline phosphatase D
MLRHRILRSSLLLLSLFACRASFGADDGIRITHGPMLGRQTSTSMGLWARTSKPGMFHVRYGTSPKKLDQVSKPATTSLSRDNTGVVMLTGLKPGLTYYYVAVAGEDSQAKGGSFRTLPDPKALRDAKYNPRGLYNFKFEFACGNNQSPDHGLGPSLPTFDTLLKQVRDDVDFAILNGDWLYEDDSRAYSIDSWRKQVGISKQQTPRVAGLAPPMVGVWQNYKDYLDRGKNLSEWHRHVPSYYTFDDHEILNDVFGCGTAGFRSRRALFRDIAVQAWYDYIGWSNPVVHKQGIHFGRAKVKAGSDVLVDNDADFTKIDWKQAANLHVHWGTADAGVNDTELDGKGGDPNARVYDVIEVLDKNRVRISPKATANGEVGYSIGRRSYAKFRVSNCEFYLVDTRTHREVHDIKRPDKPGLSMLGKQQTDWLIASMKASDADFHFVVSSVNFMIPHVGGGGAAFDAKTKDDAWTVFLDEREKLIDFWDDLDAPVFVLTGDLHNSFAIKVTDNVWEFASGPHNSINHRPNDEGNRPVNGKFKYGPRECDIRWSTVAMADIPRLNRAFPHYCVVQINNVFNNPIERKGTRWVAYPKPHVIFQYFDGLTGKLKYAEPIHSRKK